MRCETTSSVKECALRARSTHGVHYAIVEVNIVIGVVLGEVLVARVPLVVDAVIGLTLGLIAHVVVVVFVVAILHRIFLYGRYTLYTACSALPLPSSPATTTSQRFDAFTNSSQPAHPRPSLSRFSLSSNRNHRFHSTCPWSPESFLEHWENRLEPALKLQKEVRQTVRVSQGRKEMFATATLLYHVETLLSFWKS